MSLRIKNLTIESVGCFKKISIPFRDDMSIICGENGVGKTTLLDCIAYSFTGFGQNPKRNANAAVGKVDLSVTISGHNSQNIDATTFVNRWLPDQNIGGYSTPLRDFVQELLYIKSSRDLFYAPLASIGRDSEKLQHQIAYELDNGLTNADLKNWFANRFMFLDKKNALTSMQISNFRMAVNCISILDPSMEFATVDASTFNIMVETRDGIIPIEFLSSGYRATFYVILGIIKEIELRKLSNSANEFSGVILIDEIDLHLHPAWQRNIMVILRKVFPESQFIVTTHSPHVIQAAEGGEVIALIRDESGRPNIKPPTELLYGFKGWTVEEILEDVMGVPTTKSQLFEDTMEGFDQALTDDNPAELAKHLAALEQMLHPKSPYRKLLRLQAAPVLG